jgi:hypothetical protein
MLNHKQLFTGLCSSAVIVSVATDCKAHPGHAIQIVEPNSPVHYLLQPEHVIPCLAITLLVAWFMRTAIDKLLARSLQTNLMQR